MMKKILSLALTAVMAVGLLSGCTRGGDTSTAAETYDVLENPSITVYQGFCCGIRALFPVLSDADAVWPEPYEGQLSESPGGSAFCNAGR